MRSFLSISLLVLWLTGCQSTGEGYMQQQQLLQLIEQQKAPVIVDVRSGFEYRSGHVPGAIHVPFWDVFTTDKLENVDKTQPLVIYCEHGPRAGIAKFGLWLTGFEHIDYLTGHMTAWKKAGLPVQINH
jgi:hydroxyacylglutathione hydrolase